MISFFANIFGYLLNFLYEFLGNYGLAIILFSIVIKVIMLPISINQHKTMKKSQKVNEEMKQIQFKYKSDPEKLNQEVMALYKREKMSPFSGCLSAIVQIILLFAVFFLVRSPLTYMKKIDNNVIEKLQAVVDTEGKTSNYREISIINYINRVKKGEIEVKEEVEETKENPEEENKNQEEIDKKEEVEEKEEENKDKAEDLNIEEYIDDAYVNMNLLGVDLSKVPTEDLKDFKTLIIPILYVISSFVSIRLSTNMEKKKKKEDSDTIEIDNNKENTEDSKEEKEGYDAMQDANKTMTWFMPIMSISIACIAPLGLALYWLINNLLMIAERLILNKLIKEEE